MDWSQLEDGRLYTRNELRLLGLKYSSTQFLRWEDIGLVPVKPPGQSSRVHYLGSVVKRFFAPMRLRLVA